MSLHRLELVILQRNARLRAYKGLGVPLAFRNGWWRGQGVTERGGVAMLTLFCRSCLAEYTVVHDFKTYARCFARVYDWLGKMEHEALRALNNGQTLMSTVFVPDCHHLDALYGPDSDEVAALTGLELVAGV